MLTRLSLNLVSVGLGVALTTPAMALAGQQATALAEVAPGAEQAKPPQGSGTQKPAPQTTKPKPKPVPKLPIGLRVFGAFETTRMSAAQSFKAQTGSSSVPGFAVGGDILNLWRKVFLRVGFASGSVDGTRGFVDEVDQFISNGVPLTIGVRHFELAAGWRTYMKKHPRIALHVGAGLARASHSQKSPDPEPGDNDTKSGVGFVGLLGLEFALKKEAPARPLKRQFFAGVEAQIRSVRGVLGESGGSLAFDEDNLGGVAIRAMFGLRFKK